MLPLDTSPDVARWAPDTALVPIGSFEQHGPYLPLTTDSLIASAIVNRIAEENDVLVLPVIPISCSQEHAAFAGTVSVSATTLYGTLVDIVGSLQASGILNIFIVNAHGGNYVLSNLVQTASAAGSRLALFPSSAHWTAARKTAGVQTGNHEDMHAGEAETSILLARYPDAVRPGYLDNSDHVVEDRQYILSKGLDYYAPGGIIGRPSLATAEKGSRLLTAFAEQFSRYLEVLRDDGIDTASGS